MRLSEALALCPQLVLAEHDPAAAEEAWEEILRSLEEAGLAVESPRPGFVFFETDGIERLAGGVSRLRRALDAVGHRGSRGSARRRGASRRSRRRPSLRPHRILVVDDDESALFLEPLPLDLLSLSPERRQEISELGIKRLGELARLPDASVADRLGPDGAEAWRIVSGEAGAKVAGRRPPGEIVEELEFPEAVGNSLTLERALSALLDRLLARPERGGRAPRRIALSARLVGGGSWRRSLTLREPTSEPQRLRTRCAEARGSAAPVVALRLELGELADSVGTQAELVRPRGSRLRERLRSGLRQTRAGVGPDAVCTVVEVAPWSRIPETRAILVPRDD